MNPLINASLTFDAQTSTNGMTVQRLNPLNCPDWDALLLTHPDYTFFHSAAWARVLHDTYGSIPNYFAITAGAGVKFPASCNLADEFSSSALPPPASSRLLGLFPVMETNSLILGQRGISLPFTDECQPLASDPSMFQQLWQAAISYGKSRTWKFLTCHGGNRYLPDAPPSLSFFGHDLDLSGGGAQLFAHLAPAVRRAIRKAGKSGVSVEVSHSLEGVKTYFSLHCLTRKKHGLPPQPFSFFENVHRHVIQHGQGCVVIGHHEGKAVAAVILFFLGTKALYKFGASDESCQHLRANNLVMWEAIKWAAAQGMTRFHFGRTSFSNDGLRRYKLGWGATEQIISYFKYTLAKETFVRDKDQVVGWYNRVFRRMPLALARGAGSLLYRFM
jgi:hypothetical protein